MRIIIANDDFDKIPKLKSISQREIIAFVRKFRRFIQDNISEELINGKSYLIK